MIEVKIVFDQDECPEAFGRLDFTAKMQALPRIGDVLMFGDAWLDGKNRGDLALEVIKIRHWIMGGIVFDDNSSTMVNHETGTDEIDDDDDYWEDKTPRFDTEVVVCVLGDKWTS